MCVLMDYNDQVEVPRKPPVKARMTIQTCFRTYEYTPMHFWHESEKLCLNPLDLRQSQIEINKKILPSEPVIFLQFLSTPCCGKLIPITLKRWIWEVDILPILAQFV